MFGRNARQRGRRARSVAAVVAVIGGTLAVSAVGVTTGGPAAHAAGPTVNQTWSMTEPDAGAPDALSPPMLADLNGTKAVVVGDRAGNVYAYNLQTGGAMWTAHSAWSGGSIDGPISQAGNVISFGVGTAGNPIGGYQGVNATTGQTVWSRTVGETPANNPPVNEGDIAGLTVAGSDVFAGSLGQMADELNLNTGAVQPGFPLYQGDTNTSTAAWAPVGPNGADEYVYGGAQTGNAAQHLPQGGHVRVLNTAGQVLCNYATQQPVYSSPAVGPFLAGGVEGIVASTQYLYPGVSQNDDLLGFNTGCGLQWDRPLPGSATGSPIVVDALGDHADQVADTSYSATDLTANGTLTLVNGATGAVIWTAPTPGASLGGPVSVDLNGGQYQDLVLAGTTGAEIVDGRTGSVVWSSTSAPASQNSALVTDDANGTVGLTFAGYQAVETSPGQYALQTVVKHYEVSGSDGNLVDEAGSWPEFHHDSALSGYAGPAQPYAVACTKPTTTPDGYIIVTAKGEVFNYGNIPYCGSAINLGLGSNNIVGAAVTPDGGGYYLVSSGGGFFAFGDAQFYGSASTYHPQSPIVGMAVTAQGGYYEVTQIGGLFSFGPGATFHGSGSSYPGARPITGMAIYPGGGYWEASGGGSVLSFNAPFKGSASGVAASPVIAIGAAADGSGYWEFTSAGGVFTYGAPNEGSSGGQPMAAAAANPKADGFWQVSPTGAIFAHGTNYYGGRSGLGTEYPVTAIAGV